MIKYYRLLAVWLMAGMFSIAATAQSLTISGIVHKDSTTEIVPAVSVIIKGTNIGTFTNSDGEFSLNVPKLPVVLLFTSIGYDNFELTVTGAEQVIDVAFVSNVALGQDVVIAASRTPQRILESPVTIERLGPANLRSLATPNYYEAIGNLKGVDMHTASLTFRTVTTRGFVASGNTRLNQLIDGMDNQAPGLNFSVGSVVGLTELDVDNIELLSGASSALYGSGGMNGTVLISSKNPFKYQGLSYNIKQGIMHTNGKQRPAAPYYDWGVRWAKVINDRWAFKISGQLVKADDWEAEDYQDKQQIGILSSVVNGTRESDPNYNGVNMYGDETSASMLSFSQLVIGKTEASIPGMTAALNSYFTAIGSPAYPTNAQVAGAVGLFAPYGAAAQAAVQNALPFYIGVRNNYFNNASISRTGYQEQNLVDYNTLNAKLTGGIYFKITPTIEASLNTYFGTGTTVYTGADRYSLRNLKIAQHKLEVKAKNWFLRGYTTQENAGESYNASALGGYLNEYWKPSATWFPQYIGTFSETKRLTQGTVPDINIHAAARAAADVGRLIPGTVAFDNAVKKIRTTPIKDGGALFLDKSDLWAGEGQLNLSDAAHFSDKIEVIAGFQYKQWIMNSQGTIFADTLGNIDISEYGGYVQLRKKLFDDKLTLTASGRYDKQTNFNGKFTPRFTGLFRVAKDNFIRASYQTAYRFPTNQDQYISLVTGSGTLIGCLPEFQSYYKLNSTLPGYTPESILAYRASGNPANVSLLVKGTYNEVKPETVSSYELGYKGIIKKKLLVDAYLYYSHYNDFLARAAVGQATPSSGTGTATDLYSPFTTTNVSYIQNSTQGVKATGWGIGLDYQAVKNYYLYANIFSDQLRDVSPGLVTFFNAPKYRWNLGLRNENVCHNVGFNIVIKWQDDNYYEGTFVTGTLPSFSTIDAQVTYRPPDTKAVFRIGGTNLTNKYNRTGYGSPAVGGLYYVSYGYNIF